MRALILLSLVGLISADGQAQAASAISNHPMIAQISQAMQGAGGSQGSGGFASLLNSQGGSGAGFASLLNSAGSQGGKIANLLNSAGSSSSGFSSLLNSQGGSSGGGFASLLGRQGGDLSSLLGTKGGDLSNLLSQKRGALTQLLGNKIQPMIGTQMTGGPMATAMNGGMGAMGGHAGGFGQMPLPTWLQGQNWTVIQEFIEIFHQNDTSIAQQKKAIIQLATDNGVGDEAQQFFTNITNFRNALVKNVTEIVNQLPQIISQMQTIMNNEDQTRQEQKNAFEALKNSSGKAFDVAISIPMMLMGGGHPTMGGMGSMGGHTMRGGHGGHGRGGHKGSGGMMHIMGGGRGGHGRHGGAAVSVHSIPATKSVNGKAAGNKKNNQNKQNKKNKGTTAGKKKATTPKKANNKKKATTPATATE